MDVLFINNAPSLDQRHSLNDLERLKELIKNRSYFSARLLAKRIEHSLSPFREDGEYWLTYSKIIDRRNEVMLDHIRLRMESCPNYSSSMYESRLIDDFEFAIKQRKLANAKNILYALNTMPSYSENYTINAMVDLFEGKIAYLSRNYDDAIYCFNNASKRWELGIKAEKERWINENGRLNETRLFLLKALVANGPTDNSLTNQPHQNLIFADLISSNTTRWQRTRAILVSFGYVGNFVDDFFI